MSDPFDDLDVFYGETTPAIGRVYARLLATSDLAGCELAGCELAGRVMGPYCRHARTLSATVRIVPRAGTGGLLAEAVIPDPCFWSDELPMLYTAHVELRRDGKAIATAERTIGFRGIGPRGRSLVREGRRWVPRGAARSSVVATEQDDLEPWRAAGAVMHCRPSEAVCREASEAGVWLVAEGPADRAALRDLARWPAVMMAVLPPGERGGEALRRAAPNVLIAERIAAPALQGWEANPFADCVFCAGDPATTSGEFAEAIRGVTLPVVIHRKLDAPRSVGEARKACDDLQRDLAPVGDFAGYFV